MNLNEIKSKWEGEMYELAEGLSVQQKAILAKNKELQASALGRELAEMKKFRKVLKQKLEEKQSDIRGLGKALRMAEAETGERFSSTTSSSLAVARNSPTPPALSSEDGARGGKKPLKSVIGGN